MLVSGSKTSSLIGSAGLQLFDVKLLRGHGIGVDTVKFFLCGLSRTDPARGWDAATQGNRSTPVCVNLTKVPHQPVAGYHQPQAGLVFGRRAVVVKRNGSLFFSM